MAFSSVSFLFVFLPVAVIAYYLPKGRLARNTVLLVLSLAFYSVGGIRALVPLLGSVAINYVAGRAIERLPEGSRISKVALAGGLIANLLILGYFKYAGFVVTTLDRLAGFSIEEPAMMMLTGVSFFTFLGMSYLIDVYRRKAPAARSILDVALYQGEFPTLVAGPIIRWEQFWPQVRDRRESVTKAAYGTTRFVIGLAKKVMISGALATMASQVQGTAPATMSTVTAWLGALAYTLHIYFDFSGYSDMAIGLGSILGLTLPENFRYPYVSQSITEFWRRWHITLGQWFREYVYIPLGGNRVGRLRLVLNLLAVWALTGLWHGAAWTFVAWGLYYGVIIAAEKLFLGQVLERLWRPLRHVYVMLIVLSSGGFCSARRACVLRSSS